jgi:hypothetical protein
MPSATVVAKLTDVKATVKKQPVKAVPAKTVPDKEVPVKAVTAKTPTAKTPTAKTATAKTVESNVVANSGDAYFIPSSRVSHALRSLMTSLWNESYDDYEDHVANCNKWLASPAGKVSRELHERLEAAKKALGKLAKDDRDGSPEAAEVDKVKKERDSDMEAARDLQDRVNQVSREIKSPTKKDGEVLKDKTVLDAEKAANEKLLSELTAKFESELTKGKPGYAYQKYLSETARVRSLSHRYNRNIQDGITGILDEALVELLHGAKNNMMLNGETQLSLASLFDPDTIHRHHFSTLYVNTDVVSKYLRTKETDVVTKPKTKKTDDAGGAATNGAATNGDAHSHDDDYTHSAMFEHSIDKIWAYVRSLASNIKLHNRGDEEDSDKLALRSSALVKAFLSTMLCQMIESFASNLNTMMEVTNFKTVKHEHVVSVYKMLLTYAGFDFSYMDELIKCKLDKTRDDVEALRKQQGTNLNYHYGSHPEFVPKAKAVPKREPSSDDAEKKPRATRAKKDNATDGAAEAAEAAANAPEKKPRAPRAKKAAPAAAAAATADAPAEVAEKKPRAPRAKKAETPEGTNGTVDDSATTDAAPARKPRSKK